MSERRAAGLGAAELGCGPGRARREPQRPAPGRTRCPARRRRPPGTFGVRILGVSEVTRAIRGAVRADPRLADLWVEGEIGRVTISSAGHAYFALKDERNQLQCVWFRDDRLRSAFEAQAGLRVVAHGRIDLFEPQGALQLYVESIQPAGLGDLTLRFEALKARLAAEGLFDAARKRPLPTRPATIAVITSPTGAVWKDICHVLARRWPLTRVVLVAAQVQGESAPASLVGAFRKVERYAAARIAAGRPDEAPGGHDPGPRRRLARGPLGVQRRGGRPGGRRRTRVPVVCGVGHEADVTLADFAADVRAPTPSAAAEIVVPDRAEFLAAVRSGGRRLDGAAAMRLRTTAREVVAERRALDRLSPAAQLASARERVGLLLDRATRAIAGELAGGAGAWRAARRRARPDPARPAGPRSGPARALGRPRSARGRGASAAARVVARGGRRRRSPSSARRPRSTAATPSSAGPTTAAIVRDPADAPPGTRLALRVAQGELPATADER